MTTRSCDSIASSQREMMVDDARLELATSALRTPFWRRDLFGNQAVFRFVRERFGNAPIALR